MERACVADNGVYLDNFTVNSPNYTVICKLYEDAKNEQLTYNVTITYEIEETAILGIFGEFIPTPISSCIGYILGRFSNTHL